MCRCEKPNVNGTPGAYSWDGRSRTTYQVNPPALRDDDKLIYDEPGRCGGIDCHSHHFRLVEWYASYNLLVRHGAGDERLMFPVTGGQLLPSLETMDSNTRYWLFHSIYSAYSDGRDRMRDELDAHWRAAAAEGRIRTRKLPKRGSVKVWIDAPAQIPMEGLTP